ncbi:MAG: hypothetical protein RL748_2921, partial [Pseudomonadota bacterium]
FGGYGTVALEENWDDFKGVDVKGKILLLLANDPQPTASEAERFGGKALTYYGRSSYKYEQAKRMGAAGVLIVHTDASTSYGWSLFQNGIYSERFQLQNDSAGLPFQGWINEAAAKKLIAASGQDWNSLLARAETRDFRITPLNLKVEGASRAVVRKIDQYNIAAVVPGTDPQLKNEVVIYSAHWDHLGIKKGKNGQPDVIFNGAVDNASGTAALLAMAKAAVQAPTKRSQLFLWVAAEEQGLLGSAAYVAQPLWPLHKTAANLNLDTMNFVGRTSDISLAGSERSDLGQLAQALAKESNLNVAAPRPDTGGYYFRSDHFSFAKAGIPAFSVGKGREYLIDPKASQQKGAAYGQRYHQSSDKYDPNWDLSGMVQQAQFALDLGRKIANGSNLPNWKAGDPFGLIRAKTLQQAQAK